LLVWNFVEIADAESIYAHEDWSFILRSLGYLLHFGVICPLAILGLYLTKEEFKKTWHLFLILISYAASISLFFVFARFRHPMTAIIILYASAGLVCLVDFIKDKKFVKVFIGLCLLIISGMIVNREMLPRENFSSDTYYNVGTSLEQQGNIDESIKYYQTALKLNSENVMAHNNLGIILYKRGMPDEALSHFEHALRIDPTLVEAHNNIGIILFNLGKLYDALNHFESVIRLNPDYNPSIYFNIACVYARLSNIEESISWLRKATKMGYNNWDVIKTDKDLGNIRSSEGYKEIIKNH
jgi:tetratricopeptide (TPR) repeat protein